MLATLGASDEGSIQVELRECDKRLLNLKVVKQSGQDIHFLDVPNFGWNLLSPGNMDVSEFATRSAAPCALISSHD